MNPDDIAIGIIAGLLEARTGQKLTEDRRWRIAPALAGLFRDRGISSNQDLVVLLTQPDDSARNARLDQEQVARGYVERMFEAVRGAEAQERILDSFSDSLRLSLNAAETYGKIVGERFAVSHVRALAEHRRQRNEHKRPDHAMECIAGDVGL